MDDLLVKFLVRKVVIVVKEKLNEEFDCLGGFKIVILINVFIFWILVFIVIVKNVRLCLD